MPRYLINKNGDAFDSSELKQLCLDFGALGNPERLNFRDGNAAAIAHLPVAKLLIVSGPGTGKSFLFKQRINYWLQDVQPSAHILAVSFVRKLVADLNNDIQSDRSLNVTQKKQTEVHTLHKYARSIVERNHGTTHHAFRPHFRIIGESWKGIVWKDALALVGQKDEVTFSWKNFEKQLHDASFENSSSWPVLSNSYFELSKFYNAAGFGDLIIHAREALTENSSLGEHEFFIIDEYQDFNKAEEELIKTLTRTAHGVLIAGDDDQVLYETLKSGKAALIRSLYRDTSVANAMLPFCGRSSFHIVKAAGHFIQQNPDADSIEKIYLPVSNDADCPKVHLVGCATSGAAVEYIEKFVEANKESIEARQAALSNGESKDPFLLILTPSNALKFYASNNARTRLLDLVAQYQVRNKAFGDDYYKILNYYSLANYPENNFIFRKVIHYEGLSHEKTIDLVKRCIAGNINFCDLRDDAISTALARCASVKSIIDSSESVEAKIVLVNKVVSLLDEEQLKTDLAAQAIGEPRVQQIEHEEEEEAELEELEVKQMAAVELLSIVGSKGLSADHVIIVGFDDVNLSWVTRNAFYVAMTRARKSLQLITALQSGGSQKPHQYIDSLPDAHTAFFKYTKKEGSMAPLGSRGAFLSYLGFLNKKRKFVKPLS